MCDVPAKPAKKKSDFDVEFKIGLNLLYSSSLYIMRKLLGPPFWTTWNFLSPRPSPLPLIAQPPSPPQYFLNTPLHWISLLQRTSCVSLPRMLAVCLKGQPSSMGMRLPGNYPWPTDCAFSPGRRIITTFGNFVSHWFSDCLFVPKMATTGASLKGKVALITGINYNIIVVGRWFDWYW